MPLKSHLEFHFHQLKSVGRALAERLAGKLQNKHSLVFGR